MQVILHEKKHPASYIEDTGDYIFQNHQESFPPHDESDYWVRLVLDVLAPTPLTHDTSGHTHYQIQMDCHLCNILSHNDLVTLLTHSFFRS